MGRIRVNVAVVLVLLALALFEVDSMDAMEAPQNQPRQRHRRSFLQFSAMITCTTRRVAWDFNQYGCYCGIGGRGTPVDPIDSACQRHDDCYGALTAADICSSDFAMYMENYKFRMSCGRGNTRILCDASQNSPCQQGVCECDRVAALEFKQELGSYDKSYKGYSRLNCRS